MPQPPDVISPSYCKNWQQKYASFDMNQTPATYPETVEILGLPVHMVTMDQTVALARRFMA